ncbi:MAG: sigma-70 family RNA polymerase sigma factor [bacterium]|nr:sigma-70 family RNA polymerase sigma factor [bacterium]
METTLLLERCRAGDQLAWEHMVRQYQSRICAVAYTYVNNTDEARDLAQEIFVRIYRSLDKCRDPERFLAWIIKIARNACLDHLRRLKSRPPRHDIPADGMYNLVDPGPTPEDDWVTDSRRRLVYTAMRSMSKINCEIILLKDMQGLQLEEIADMLGIPVGTVKSRSNRARLELAHAVRALDGPSGDDSGERRGIA